MKVFLQQATIYLIQRVYEPVYNAGSEGLATILVLKVDFTNSEYELADFKVFCSN